MPASGTFRTPECNPSANDFLIPSVLNSTFRVGLSRAPFWRGTVPSADKLQDRHLPQPPTVLVQCGFKVFKNWSYFWASRNESLGTQFTDAIF